MQTGRKCSICCHPETAAITKLLAAGGSKRVVAAQFGLNDSAIQRHRQNCLRLSSKEKTPAAAVEPIVSGGSGRFASLEPAELVAATATLVDEALNLLEPSRRCRPTSSLEIHQEKSWFSPTLLVVSRSRSTSCSWLAQ